MALADLLSTLESEGRARAEAVVTRARAEAEQITREAGVRAEARRAARLAERERELRARAAGALEAARREAVRRHLMARATVLERIFARVRQLLLEAAATVPRSSLGADLTRALGCLGGRPAVVRCHPQVAASIRDLVAGLPVTSVVPDPRVSGLLVTAEDGSIEVDASLATRLDRLRPQLAIELLRDLEPAP